MLPAFFVRSRGAGKLYGLLFTPLLERHTLTQLEADIILFLANNPEYDTARDIVEKAQELVEAANENGGKDNISVILIEPSLRD